MNLFHLIRPNMLTQNTANKMLKHKHSWNNNNIVALCSSCSLNDDPLITLAMRKNKKKLKKSRCKRGTGTVQNCYSTDSHT